MRITSLLAITALSSGALASSTPDLANILEMFQKKDANEAIASLFANPELQSIADKLSSPDIDLTEALGVLTSSSLYTQAWAYVSSNPLIISTGLDYAKKAGLLTKKDSSEVLLALISDPSVKDIIAKVGSSGELTSLLTSAQSSPLYSQALLYAATNPDLLPQALEYAKKLDFLAKKEDHDEL